MKPMIYAEKRIFPEVLYKAEYKGHKALIVSFGTHPCAYVENKFCPDMESKDFISYPDLEVNGGVNFCSDRKEITGENTSYFGWDYHHCWDYSGSPEIRNCFYWKTPAQAYHGGNF